MRLLKVTAIVLALVLIIFIAGCEKGGGETPKKTPLPAPFPLVYQDSIVKISLTDGYTIDKIKDYPLKEGRYFVVLELSVECLSDSFSTFFFDIIDSQDRVYKASAATNELDQPISFLTLYPGDKTEGGIAFEVLKDATGLKLRCREYHYFQDPILFDLGI